MLDRTYKSGHITDKQLLTDLRNLAYKLGRYPNGRDIHNEWSGRQTKYFRAFGTIKNAILKAGLLGDPAFQKPPKSKISLRRAPFGPTKDQLLSEIKRLADELGHTPTDPEMRKHGRYPITRFWKMFGKWSTACRQAGLEPHTNHEGGPHRVPVYKYKRRDKRTVRLTGSYEVRFVKVLDRLGVDWQSHGDFSPLLYRDADGKIHRYMPDFYIPAWGLYVETKGWYREKDKIKMQCVSRDNPGVTVIVIGKDALAQFERTKRLPLL